MRRRIAAATPSSSRWTSPRPDHIGPGLFRQSATLGRELVALHLLDADAAPALLKPITRYPVGGDSTVEKGHPRYDQAQRRVYISKDNAQDRQTGPILRGRAARSWNFQVGGYQPCQKWLKIAWAASSRTTT